MILSVGWKSIKKKETEDRVRLMEATVASLPTMDMVEGITATVPGDMISKAELEARLATLQRGPRYVTDKDAPMNHVVASAHPQDSPVWHRTRCGWEFGPSQRATRSDDPPPGLRMCITCAGSRSG